MLPIHDRAIASGAGHTMPAGTMYTKPGTPNGWVSHITSTKMSGPTIPVSVSSSSTLPSSVSHAHPPSATTSTTASTTTPNASSLRYMAGDATAWCRQRSQRYVAIVSATSSPSDSLPLIDVSALLDPHSGAADLAEVATAIDDACRSVGFFSIVGHGVPTALQARLEAASHDFFARPEDAKQLIAMEHAGAAWRGWFPVGGELTSGVPDRKEGIYFGSEYPPDHPRVLASVALHGQNQFPADDDDLRTAVLEWLDALRPVADAVMRGIALGLGLPPEWFEQHLTGDPTILFRIFHYPPSGTGG